MENGSGAKSLHLSTRLLERFFHPFRSDKLYKIVHRSGQSLLIFHSILARVTHILTNPGKGFTFLTNPGKGYKQFNQSWPEFHILNQSWQWLQIFQPILSRFNIIFTNQDKNHKLFDKSKVFQILSNPGQGQPSLPILTIVPIPQFPYSNSSPTPIVTLLPYLPYSHSSLIPTVTLLPQLPYSLHTPIISLYSHFSNSIPFFISPTPYSLHFSYFSLSLFLPHLHISLLCTLLFPYFRFPFLHKVYTSPPFPSFVENEAMWKY